VGTFPRFSLNPTRCAKEGLPGGKAQRAESDYQPSWLEIVAMHK
jgi:hypothetical protein